MKAYCKACKPNILLENGHPSLTLSLPTLHCSCSGMGQGLRALPAPAPPGPFPGPLSEPGIGVSLLGAAHVSVGEEGKTSQK